MVRRGLRNSFCKKGRNDIPAFISATWHTYRRPAPLMRTLERRRPPSPVCRTLIISTIPKPAALILQPSPLGLFYSRSLRKPPVIAGPRSQIWSSLNFVQKAILGPNPGQLFSLSPNEARLFIWHLLVFFFTGACLGQTCFNVFYPGAMRLVILCSSVQESQIDSLLWLLTQFDSLLSINMDRTQATELRWLLLLLLSMLMHFSPFLYRTEGPTVWETR